MEFLNYFSNVFTFGNILILILGTIGGLLMGAAPGLSPTMAVALLIPFTFKMSPDQGLIMLGAVYTSTVAGGAILPKGPSGKIQRFKIQEKIK